MFAHQSLQQYLMQIAQSPKYQEKNQSQAHESKQHLKRLNQRFFMPTVRFRWSRGQESAYLQFLSLNKKILETKQRLKKGFFQKMSNYIKSKTKDQCKNHHQKMMTHYKTLEDVFKRISSRFHISLAEIEAMRKSYIDYDCYRQKCDKNLLKGRKTMILNERCLNNQIVQIETIERLVRKKIWCIQLQNIECF